MLHQFGSVAPTQAGPSRYPRAYPTLVDHWPPTTHRYSSPPQSQLLKAFRVITRVVVVGIADRVKGEMGEGTRVAAKGVGGTDHPENKRYSRVRTKSAAVPPAAQKGMSDVWGGARRVSASRKVCNTLAYAGGRDQAYRQLRKSTSSWGITSTQRDKKVCVLLQFPAVDGSVVGRRIGTELEIPSKETALKQITAK